MAGDMPKTERLELESQVRTSYVSSPVLQTVREAIKPDRKLLLMQEIHMYVNTNAKSLNDRTRLCMA